jgi:hypothetical protein
LPATKGKERLFFDELHFQCLVYGNLMLCKSTRRDIMNDADEDDDGGGGGKEKK